MENLRGPKAQESIRSLLGLILRVKKGCGFVDGIKLLRHAFEVGLGLETKCESKRKSRNPFSIIDKEKSFEERSP